MTVTIDPKKMTKYYLLPDGSIWIGCYVNRILWSYVRKEYNSVLDVGCSKGLQLDFFRSRGIKTVAGCDIDPEAKEICDSKGIGFTLVDLNDENLILPYETDEFDIVMCNHVLEHIKYPAVAVEEMVRVAKNIVVAVFPCGTSYESPDHINFWYTFGDVREALLSPNWTFSLEVAITKPIDVQVQQAAFILCIYTSPVLDNILPVTCREGDHHPYSLHLGGAW